MPAQNQSQREAILAQFRQHLTHPLACGSLTRVASEPPVVVEIPPRSRFWTDFSCQSDFLELTTKNSLLNTTGGHRA
jgi:hypothetical protein